LFGIFLQKDSRQAVVTDTNKRQSRSKLRGIKPM